jgi:hypothetical protein
MFKMWSVEKMKHNVSVVRIKWDFDKVREIADKEQKINNECESTHIKRPVAWLSRGMQWKPSVLNALRKHATREDGTKINHSTLMNAILEYYFNEVENDKR